MRQWRVGTFSMGLLLLFSGFGLLYAQFNHIAVAHAAIKFWPLLFIVLGIEVLAQYYLNKADNNKIKYDIFSIFIILLIVFAGLGIQAATEVGLVKYAQNQLSMQDYSLQSPAKEIPLDKTIEKIVIDAEPDSLLKINTAPSHSILYFGTVRLRAQSKEEAANYLEQQTQINSHRAGNTLYVNISSSEANRFRGSNYTLVLPENVAVEIDHGSSSLQINAAGINQNWQVNGEGSTHINVGAQEDLLVTALSTDASSLKGNLTWTRLNGKPLIAEPNRYNVQTPNNGHMNGNSDDPNINGDDTGLNENNQQAQTKLGEGTHKLTIINASHITVNQLP